MKKDNEENKFMKLWNNKRTHAALVLGMWGLFLLFVVIISFIGGEATQNNHNNEYQNKPVEEEKAVFKDYQVMQSELLNSDYNYEYVITSGENKIIYKGTKTSINEVGYRETATETIKYQIDDTGFYKVLMDELHAYDKLFENVNESYIDLEYIFNEINNQSVASEIVEENRTFKYNYMIEDITYDVVVTTDLNNINKIEVRFDNNYYELKYSEIAKTNEIGVNEVN